MQGADNTPSTSVSQSRYGVDKYCSGTDAPPVPGSLPSRLRRLRKTDRAHNCTVGAFHTAIVFRFFRGQHIRGDTAAELFNSNLLTMCVNPLVR